MEWARHQRAAQPLSLAILDVDHFKRFNDTFGHTRGDDVLRAVAGSIRDMLRRTGDFAARLGGEEFVLVFSGADAQSSAVMAEHVRQAMEQIELPVGKITVSIGGITLIRKGSILWNKRWRRLTNYFMKRSKMVVTAFVGNRELIKIRLS